MKLYNSHTDSIGKFKTITDGNTVYIVSKLTEQALNDLGYYEIVYESQPSRRYYISTQVKTLIANKYTVSFTSVQKELSDVKALMYTDWLEYANEKEEALTVDSSIGINVKANSSALQAFGLGAKRGGTTVRDSNYQKHTVM